MIFRVPFHLLKSMHSDMSDVDTFTDRMTQLGHECSAAYPVTIHEKIVIGRVLAVDVHPNADKLKVCSVDVGQESPLVIVCGCPSVCVDMIVPVATIGTKLTEITIKKSKLRGIESHGMLCSARELGIEGHYDGLMSLDNTFVVGKKLNELSLFTQAVIEFDITPNRGDCLSVCGLLRDYCACYGGDVVDLDLSGDWSSTLSLASSSTDAARSFSGAKILLTEGSLPFIIKHYLSQSGMKLIHPVVDTLHYVMLLIGQPMHAYDAQNLKGNLVSVRGVSDDITLIDGSTIRTDADDIVISDGSIVVALACIMGGFDSMVTQDTQSCVLEACVFDPEVIALTNRARRIQSDSAMRFERGVCASLPMSAIKLSVNIMVKYGIAKLVGVDLKQAQPVNKVIQIRKNHIATKLGVDISDEIVMRILTSLNCLVKSNGLDWDVQIPDFRFDLRAEIDLIEELVRIYGYDQIAELPELYAPMPYKNLQNDDRVIQFFAHRGLQEVITYSLISQNDREFFDLTKIVPEIENPINNQMTHLRESILPGLYKTLKYNAVRQKVSHRYFELANVFDQHSESKVVALLFSGRSSPSAYLNKQQNFSYYDLQREVIALLDYLTITDIAFVKCEKEGFINCASIVCKNIDLGYIGQLHPKLDVNDAPVYYSEIKLSELLNIDSNVRYTAAFDQPESVRDITWVCPRLYCVGDLISEINNIGLKCLKHSNVFDIYFNNTVDGEYKHVSTRHVFQSSKTLTDKEVDAYMNTLINTVLDKQKLKVG